MPVWHEARRELPFVFAAGAGDERGRRGAPATPPAAAAPARRLAVGGAVAAVAATVVMERRLGELRAPYGAGAAGRLSAAALGLTGAGAAVVAGLGARSRPAAVAGGALLLGGAVLRALERVPRGLPVGRRPGGHGRAAAARIAAGERRGASRRNDV